MVNEFKKPANYLTLLRVILTGANYWAALNRNVSLFIALFVLAGLTDVLDGFVARKRKETSPFGAQFDSFADYFLYASMAVWLLLFEPELFQLAPAQIVLFLIAVYLLAKIILRRPFYLHLWPSKLAAWFAYAFTVATILFGLIPFMLYLLLFFTSFAIFYELHFLLWRNP